MAPWLSIAVGALLYGKTLHVPFWQDDRVQRAMALGGFPAHRSALDLYDFVHAGERDAFVQLGVLPWWTADGFSMRFFRPLASASLYAEHRWLGSPLAMHAISLAWWAAAVAAAWWLFRRVVAERAAAIATLIFALAPCHAPALGMLAQREVLMALAFGMGGLALLENAPTTQPTRPIHLAAAGAMFALALGAGEYALCFGGYTLAQLALDARPLRERLRRALPFAVPAACYLGVRASLGYGASGGGFYRDPIHAPMAFAIHAPRALLTLVVDAWSSVPAESLPLLALVGIGAVLGVVLVRAMRAPQARSGSLRWLVCGSFAALAPLLASAPGERLVGPALIGIAPALGTVVDAALASRRVWLGGAALAVVALHLGYAPLASFREARAEVQQAQSQANRTATLEARSASAAPGSVGIVALASWETAFFTDVHAAGVRIPWHILITARHALVLRTDAHTIDVVVPKGQGFFPVGADNIFRAEADPLRTGDERVVADMHVVIVSDGQSAAPPRMRFTFDRPLDDAGFVWLTQRRSGFEAMTPPALGYGTQLSP